MHYSMLVRWGPQFALFMIMATSSCSGVEISDLGRSARSLVNTFPFNQQSIEVPEPIAAKQGNDEQLIDFNTVAAAGKRCIDKIITEEETEYDEVYECNHSYNRRCTTSYTTTYNAQQEEECEDNYSKNCYIQYSPTAFKAKVEVCTEPLVKDCGAEGPIVCSTEYQSECETVQHEHQVEDDVAACAEEIESKCNDVTSGYTTSQECSKWPVQKCNVEKKPVTKYSPETKCRKVPVELCGPSSCPVVPGPKECYETTRTIASEKPEEECSLEPKRSCKHVTKLVPQLEPKESCVDVPKEVCVRSQANPRKVQKPVIKKWCYTPTEESGLAPSTESSIKPASQGCPSYCEDAKRRGTCDPRCDAYVNECGVIRCPSTTPPPSCPSYCEDAKRRGTCDPRCDAYVNECGVIRCPSTTPPPSCPSYCEDAKRRGTCDPRCDAYVNECGVIRCPSTTHPPSCPSYCEDAKRRGTCDPRCDAYVNECGVIRCPSTTPPPSCPSYCENAKRTGTCDPRCDAFVNECGVIRCPTPPPVIYDPPATTTTTPPPPSCPSSCRPGFQSNGRCELQCHIPLCNYDPDCNTPPPVVKPDNTYLPPREDTPSSYGGRGDTLVLDLPARGGGYKVGRERATQRRQPVASSTRNHKVSAPAPVNQRERVRTSGPRFNRRPAPVKTNTRNGRQDTKDTGVIRNNWDLYFKTGLVKRVG